MFYPGIYRGQPIKRLLKWGVFAVVLGEVFFDCQLFFTENYRINLVLPVLRSTSVTVKQFPPLFLPSPEGGSKSVNRYLRARADQLHYESMTTEAASRRRDKFQCHDEFGEEGNLSNRYMARADMESRRKFLKVVEGRIYEQALGTNSSAMLLKQEMKHELGRLGLYIEPDLV